MPQIQFSTTQEVDLALLKVTELGIINGLVLQNQTGTSGLSPKVVGGVVKIPRRRGLTADFKYKNQNQRNFSNMKYLIIFALGSLFGTVFSIAIDRTSNTVPHETGSTLQDSVSVLCNRCGFETTTYIYQLDTTLCNLKDHKHSKMPGIPSSERP